MLIDQLFETARQIGIADEFKLINPANGFRTTNFIIEKALEHLDRAGIDADALSERDKFIELRQPIAAAIDWATLAAAREEFVDFETTHAAYAPGTIDDIIKRIRERLARVGKDAAALDESGESSAAQMEERLKAAYKRANLIGARQAFSDFETGDYFSTGIYEVESFTNLDWISIHLHNAEEDITALDESGESTAAQINERLEIAYRRAQLITARQEFSRFETEDFSRISMNSIKDIEKTINDIRERLGYAGASDLAALDESGKSSATQMHERMIAGVIRANLMVARKTLAELETANKIFSLSSVDGRVSEIKERLTYLGLSAAALDESGKSTDSEMEERIQAAVKRANLNFPREQLAYLETGKHFGEIENIDSIVKQMIDGLAAAGSDAAALDESGKSTVVQMKKRIRAAYKRANLIAAREEFSEFETGTYFHRGLDFNSIVESIRKKLKRAKQSVAALDESGESADAQMEERIEAAVKRANLTAARKEFTNFETHGSFRGSVEETIDQIRKRVERAGETIAALDESGESTDAQMEQRIAAAAKTAYLTHARQRFSWLERVASSHMLDLPYIEETIEKIRRNLANAGKDAAALDESGESNVAQMERHFETVAQQARNTAKRNTKDSKPTGGLKLFGARGKRPQRSRSPTL